MRLIFLTNCYPPDHIGGYEELCAEVAEGLRRCGHTVSIVTTVRGQSGCARVEGEVHRILLPEIDWRPFLGTLNFFAGRARRAEETVRRFQEHAAAFRPDAIVVWGMWNMPHRLLEAIESWRQPKVVYYLADLWPTLPPAYRLHWQEPARHAFAALPRRMLCRLATWILDHETPPEPLRLENTVCVSQALKQNLIRGGARVEQARVIYNGIDLEPFAALRRSGAVRRQPGQAPSLLYAGRLSADKGVHTAIEALGCLAAQGKRLNLAIAGWGECEYEAELHALCDRLQVAGQVTFLGMVPRTEMPALLTQHDILLCPSIWPEPLPRIIQEAMAAGLAVVGTEVGGLPEILKPEANALTFPAGQAGPLAACIARLADEPGLYARLVEAGWWTVRDQFTITRMLAEFEGYLNEVLAAPEIFLPGAHLPAYRLPVH